MVEKQLFKLFKQQLHVTWHFHACAKYMLIKMNKRLTFFNSAERITSTEVYFACSLLDMLKSGHITAAHANAAQL
jgi:hypothetical protein